MVAWGKNTLEFYKTLNRVALHREFYRGRDIQWPQREFYRSWDIRWPQRSIRAGTHGGSAKVICRQQKAGNNELYMTACGL